MLDVAEKGLPAQHAAGKISAISLIIIIIIAIIIMAKIFRSSLAISSGNSCQDDDGGAKSPSYLKLPPNSWPAKHQSPDANHQCLSALDQQGKTFLLLRGVGMFRL